MPSYHTYYYEEDFQNLILACLIDFPLKFAAVGSLVKPEYFEGLQASQLCNALRTYHKKWNSYPTFHVLSEYALKTFKDEDADGLKAIKEYLTKLSEISTREVDYVVSETARFARERALINAVSTAAACLQDKEWPKEGFAAVFEEAMRVGQDITDIGYSLVDDSDKIIDLVTQDTYGLKTGFNHLDALWRNGWGPGWLIVPLAPPKAFKTCFCLNLALSIASHSSHPGRKPRPVFYYACEITAELAALRAYSRLTGWTQNAIYGAAKTFKAGLKEHYLSTIGAPIIIKFFPAKTATIADISDHAKMLTLTYKDEAGAPLMPGAIIVDHAETIRPMESKDKISDWREQADIYTAARAMGSRFNCPVIMPDRCNREASEKTVPSRTDFQGAFEKAGIVDVGIGICQTAAERTKKEEERNEQTGQPEVWSRVRYFIFLNRHGEQYAMFSGKVYPETMKMTIDQPEHYIEEPQGSAPADSKKHANKKGHQLPPEAHNKEQYD